MQPCLFLPLPLWEAAVMVKRGFFSGGVGEGWLGAVIVKGEFCGGDPLLSLLPQTDGEGRWGFPSPGAVWSGWQEAPRWGCVTISADPHSVHFVPRRSGSSLTASMGRAPGR